MGCFQSKDEVVQPLPRYQHSASIQAWQQQPQGHRHDSSNPKQPEPPFMRTAAPNGLSWSQYVQTEGASFVDPSSNLLAGPWAECLSWAVKFEHMGDWSSLPEYVGQDGPAGGVLAAYEASLANRADRRKLLEAANRLEEACHAAEELQGQETEVTGDQQIAYDVRPPRIQQEPVYSWHPRCSQGPPNGLHPPLGQPPFGQQPPSGQQPLCGQQLPYGQQPSYSQELPYGQQPQWWPPYGEPPQSHQSQAMVQHGPGPTLLQQQSQSHAGGFSTGAKVAAAAAGGLALGAGAYYAAEHAGEIGESLGEAGAWAASAAEDAGGAVVDLAEEFF